MRKTLAIFILSFFLLTLGYGISFCEEIDLSGKWEGTTEVPGSTEPDKLTLILEKKDGEYSGILTDSLGFAQDEEIKDAEFEDSTLTFNFTIFTGDEYMQIFVTLTVEEDKMSGYWEGEDGSSAPVELTRVE